MNRLKSIFIWLRRMGHSCGFGIQSPTDYWLVRYVVNEHWPYYQYSQLGLDHDWLTRKLGLLYFRLANWRQPSVIVTPPGYEDYWLAGCRRARLAPDARRPVELMLLTLQGDYQARFQQALEQVNDQSVIIIERIWQAPEFWQQVVTDERTGVTFDLYYCGLVMFDKKRTKQNYIINF